ncbi:MAG: SoxR reducing system RseC family protein [Bacteroidaceae bacterium]|nr:SoxR reducing system RseC family protein [Bacteroidaceae bacterium]
MKGRQIEHRGVVERVMSHGLVVSIMQDVACSACAAAALCHSAEKKQKTMEVLVADSSCYHVGQEVVVVGELGLGLQATLWAYVVPLVLLMVVLLTAARLTGREGLAALLALLSLVPYFVVLYLLRNRLQQSFTFSIKS